MSQKKLFFEQDNKLGYLYIQTKFDLEIEHLEKLLDCDYIIHLAGYSISNSWTTRNKAIMYNSRVEGANLLFDKCVEFNVFPEMFISLSR